MRSNPSRRNMRVRQESPYQDVRQRVDAATREERKDWSPEELFHIISGYKHALKISGATDNAYKEKLSELLRNTHRFNFRNYAAAHFKHYRFDGIPFFEPFWLTTTKSILRPFAAALTLPFDYLQRKKAHDMTFHWGDRIFFGKIEYLGALGEFAAHEATHYLVDRHYLNTEFLPTLSQLTYAEENYPRVFNKMKKKDRITYHEMITALHESIAAIKKEKDAPDAHYASPSQNAIITSAIHKSLQARLGKEKADEFLRLVYAGDTPFSAWKTIAFKYMHTDKFYPLLDRVHRLRA